VANGGCGGLLRSIVRMGIVRGSSIQPRKCALTLSTSSIGVHTARPGGNRRRITLRIYCTIWKAEAACSAGPRIHRKKHCAVDDGRRSRNAANEQQPSIAIRRLIVACAERQAIRVNFQ
jgi:hypothetical protein